MEGREEHFVVGKAILAQFFAGHFSPSWSDKKLSDKIYSLLAAVLDSSSINKTTERALSGY